MRSFLFYNPTRIHFGTHAVTHLSEELAGYGKNVLLCYGGGSIKRNGVYDSVLDALHAAGKAVFELPGIMPNPRTEKVYEGISLCREHRIDFILAVGGGSAIDCAKLISAGAKLAEGEDFWEKLMIRQEPISEMIPLGVVLTIAATGSEMDAGGVITNWEQRIKTSYSHPLLRPSFAILDPTYTYSLPREQMIYGAVDTLSHIFELYFSRPDESCLSDDMAEGAMRSVIENLNAALQNPRDYTARANLMWASSMALNGILSASKEQDWQAHEIEHALSAFYDIPHGAGLAVVHPNYLRYTCRFAPKKFARYAVRMWGVDPSGKTEEEIALEGISRTRAYFDEIGAPATLADVGVPDNAVDRVAASVRPGGGAYHALTREDIRAILELCTWR